jgi:hypothetical protein
MPIHFFWEGEKAQGRRSFMKISTNISIAFVLLCGVTLTAVSKFQNATYAENQFENKVNYEDVLASRKWLSLGEFWGCTYAVVSLDESATEAPPAKWLRDARWHPTPVHLPEPMHHGKNTNPASACVSLGVFSTSTADRLESAVREPGSYYLQLGETLYLYSRSQKIAAEVRYGD